MYNFKSVLCLHHKATCSCAWCKPLRPFGPTTAGPDGSRQRNPWSNTTSKGSNILMSTTHRHSARFTLPWRPQHNPRTYLVTSNVCSARFAQPWWHNATHNNKRQTNDKAPDPWNQISNQGAGAIRTSRKSPARFSFTVVVIATITYR
jgi:hypothetical protein